ncbi:MAG: hypothetical protein WEH44_04235 [Pirellulaceae bacterium]
MSPVTIGLEAPGPGSSVFHTTFSVALQVVGSPLSLLAPPAERPRNPTQSPASPCDEKRANPREREAMSRRMRVFLKGAE